MSAAVLGGHLRRWLVLRRVEARVPALPRREVPGGWAEVGSPAFPRLPGARAVPAPPLLPPSHGITRFLGADSESGKAGTPSRQGRDKKLLLKVCFLNVFKCHICFV